MTTEVPLNDTPKSEEQAVLVCFSYAVSSIKLFLLEQQLSVVIDKQNLGEYDGNEIGRDEAMLYMYGPDAERLFTGIKPVLEKNSIYKNAVVIIRHGAPGAEERKERITIKKRFPWIW